MNAHSWAYWYWLWVVVTLFFTPINGTYTLMVLAYYIHQWPGHIHWCCYLIVYTSDRDIYIDVVTLIYAPITGTNTLTLLPSYLCTNHRNKYIDVVTLLSIPITVPNSSLLLLLLSLTDLLNSFFRFLASSHNASGHLLPYPLLQIVDLFILIRPFCRPVYRPVSIVYFISLFCPIQYCFLADLQSTSFSQQIFLVTVLIQYISLLLMICCFL